MSPTYQELAQHYLSSLAGDERARDTAELLLSDHIIPKFGARRLTDTNAADLQELIAGAPDMVGAEASQLEKLLKRMWTLAVDMKFVPAEAAASVCSTPFGRPDQGFALLTAASAKELLIAARSSPNRQLKYIMALLMLTGARTREILNSRWDDFDLNKSVWRIHVSAPGTARELKRMSPRSKCLPSYLAEHSSSSYVVRSTASRERLQSADGNCDLVRSPCSRTAKCGVQLRRLDAGMDLRC